MTTPTMTLDVPPDERGMRFERFVAAPPELVYEVMTTPEHLQNWWGPARYELVVDRWDLRVGGGYRYVSLTGDGQQFAFHGVFRELEPPHRISQTFVYEGAPDHEAVDTIELRPVAGGTLVVGTSVHDTVEARDAHVAAGMEGGMRESYDRLDALVERLQG